MKKKRHDKVRKSWLRKTGAIMSLKVKMLLNNTSALTGPLMAIGMTLLMRVLYSSMSSDPEQLDYLMGMALNLGVSFNIGMGAIMMTALPLAEDKEKFTLRALMTSSVNGSQFFVGSLMPPVLITIVVNFILIFVSGVNVQNVNFLMFTIMTVVSALTSCILGLLIGVYSKSQVNANNIMMPFTLILAMLPTFSMFNESIATVSKYLYTGIFAKMLDAFVVGEVFRFEVTQIAILAIGMVVLAGLFIFYYKKNGFETE